MFSVSPCAQDFSLLLQSAEVAILEPAVRLSIQQAVEQECIAAQIKSILPGCIEISSEQMKFSKDNRLAVVNSDSTEVVVFAVTSQGDVRPIVRYRTTEQILSVDLVTLFSNEPYVSIMMSDPHTKYRQVLGRLTDYIIAGDEQTQVNIPASLSWNELNR